MKVLVTGATGFVGRHLSLKLVELGWDVLATGRNKVAGQWLVDHGVTFQPADLCCEKKVEQIVGGQQIVFHCAALSSAWGSKQDFSKINIEATDHLLNCALDAKVHRVIHLSSPSIYFEFEHRRNIHEGSVLPEVPVNNYAWSKREAEKVVDFYSSRGLDCVTLRPRGIIGPYDSALVPRLVRASSSGFLPIPNGGKAQIDLTSVENLVDALILAADFDKKIAGRKFNICNGTPVYVRSFLEKALKSLGVKARLLPVPLKLSRQVARYSEWRSRVHPERGEPRITEYALGLLGYDQTLDISAAQRDLGYRARVSLDDSIDAIGDWWRREHG